MVSKSQLKLITSLLQKKYREKTGFFVAEGPKVIAEFLKSNFELAHLYTVDESNKFLKGVSSEKIQTVTKTELQKLSFLKTANSSVALFKIPKTRPIYSDGIIIALDAVRDPGNLGTIIRLCDWFDVSEIICSEDTVDCYNPKVVQATMGSLARVPIKYVNLSDYLAQSKVPVFGGVMDGTSVYKESLPLSSIVVLGNEANGISEAIQKHITHPITIPQFGAVKETESLNVATATAILLSEFKRSTET